MLLGESCPFFLSFFLFFAQVILVVLNKTVNHAHKLSFASVFDEMYIIPVTFTRVKEGLCIQT